VDLRGTGTSEPALICRDAIKRTRDLERCHEKWSAEIDLDSFRTQMIVSDLRYVLTELSLEKVSVYGVSYGTHVATEFTRSFPHMVEGLVLDSPLPRGVDVLSPLAKNAQWALNEVLLSCQKEGTCGPDLSLNRLAALVARLDQESQGAQYSGLQFLSQLSSRLYSPEVLRHLPYFILSAEKGDFRILKGLSDQLAGGRFAWGMHLSVQCAERFALTDAEKIERADSVVLPAFQPALSARDYASYCEIWKVRPEMALGPAAPIDVPTLVLSGRWDGVTPPEYARLAVRDLSHVRVVELPNLGHGAGMASCGSLWIRAFLDAPEKSLAELEVHCKRPESPYFLTTMPSEDSVQIMVAELLHTL
jgi:pimeloyl-ACP methyl ester carboxylesterase